MIAEEWRSARSCKLAWEVDEVRHSAQTREPAGGFARQKEAGGSSSAADLAAVDAETAAVVPASEVRRHLGRRRRPNWTELEREATRARKVGEADCRRSLRESSGRAGPGSPCQGCTVAGRCCTCCCSEEQALAEPN